MIAPPGAWRDHLSRLQARRTEQETRIVELLAEGLHDHEIARALGISERTFRRRLHAVMDRLGARTRAHAVALWLKSGTTTRSQP